MSGPGLSSPLFTTGGELPPVSRVSLSALGAPVSTSGSSAAPVSELGPWLRSAAAWLELAAVTVGDLLLRLADRADPPPLDGDYAGFDTRLCDLTPTEKARVMLEDAPGYYARVGAERDAEAREGRP